jgi:hypothetical protein
MHTLEREFLSWDLLYQPNIAAVAKSAYRGLSSRQHLGREEQIIGAALMFLLLCEVWQVKDSDVPELLRIADRVHKTNTDLKELVAAKVYIKNEL